MQFIINDNGEEFAEEKQEEDDNDINLEENKILTVVEEKHDEAHCDINIKEKNTRMYNIQKKNMKKLIMILLWMLGGLLSKNLYVFFVRVHLFPV